MEAMDTTRPAQSAPVEDSASAACRPPLGSQRVPLPTPWCVVREQERGYLLYNPRTDELHLLQPTAYHAYRLCDGLHTVEEVAEELALACRIPAAEALGPTTRFLADLVERGLLEVEP